MDWQTMIAFPLCFWGTYHMLNAVKDWRRHQDLTRILRDMDNLSAKIEGIKNDDKIKRVK
jgi:hypothetical protein